VLTRVQNFPSRYRPLRLNQYGDVIKPMDFLRIPSGAFSVIPQIDPRSN